MAVRVIAKKWGNSFGVILPRKLIETKRIKENDEIIIEVVKEADISSLFGTIKKSKLSGQKFKDLVKEGWE